MVLDFLFSPEVVEFVSLEDRRLTFRCRRSYKLGQSIRIKVAVPIGPKPDDLHKLQLPVVVTLVRKVEGKKKEFICQAEVPSGPKVLQQVRDYVDESKPVANTPGARRRPRHRHALRLLSKDLPGFRALSVDFNALGLQIQTEGPVELGKVLTLDVELELSTIPRVLCQGQVRWCRQLERKRYLLGLEFVDLPKDIEKDLETFEQFLVSSKQASVLQRQLMMSENLTSTDFDVVRPDEMVMPAAPLTAVPLFKIPEPASSGRELDEQEITKRFEDPTPMKEES